MLIELNHRDASVYPRVSEIESELNNFPMTQHKVEMKLTN